MQPSSSSSARAGSSAPSVSGAYKVDISRGERIGRVSSEWFSRPDDERYLSLSALHATLRARADRATARTIDTRTLRVEASRDNHERMALIVPGRDEPVAPTHWSFSQMCSLVSAPAGYLRQLPAPLAGINMQHGLLSHRAELVKTLEADDGRVYEDSQLRARVIAPPTPACPSNLVPTSGACSTGWTKVVAASTWSASGHMPTTGNSEAEEDLANGGIRRERELPAHEEVVSEPSPTREFEFDENGRDGDDAPVKARALQRQFGNAVRQAPLDPDDGLAL